MNKEVNDLVQAVKGLREAQKEYWQDRGNDLLGKLVDVAVVQVDTALEQYELSNRTFDTVGMLRES